MSITGDSNTRITRRTLLRTGGSLALGLALARTGTARASAPGYPFTLGVASGDPGPSSVVLWTRLAPDPLAPDGGMPPVPAAVRFEVATDENFHRIVRRGAVTAVPEEAHSARAVLFGLLPERVYFYRFAAGAEVSPVGRTRTAPPLYASNGSLRFAFVSCQNFREGHFNAYADVVAQDVDAVIHLGDYIYEGGSGPAVRAHAPARETVTLDDYRIRHAQYKTDPDLQAAHAALPWLVTWDDHELKNNYADHDVDPDTPREQFAERRANAYRAYWEHMPLRRARKPVGPDLPLYRRFRWGTMATFNVLDTRQYRSDQPRGCTDATRDPSGYCPDALAPERTMLGAAQRDWLFQDLAVTATRWNVLAQQIAFAPLDRNPATERRGFLTDNWDGYVAERQRLLDWLAERSTPNPVVITGDSHQNWVRNVPPNHTDFDAAPVATEFLGTSVSSGGDSPTPVLQHRPDPANPHVLFLNNNRGYVLCTLTSESWTSDYRIVPTVRERIPEATTLATFVTENGRPGAERVGASSV